nr:isoform 1 of transcription factor sp8 [Quercus suber]
MSNSGFTRDETLLEDLFNQITNFDPQLYQYPSALDEFSNDSGQAHHHDSVPSDEVLSSFISDAGTVESTKFEGGQTVWPDDHCCIEQTYETYDGSVPPTSLSPFSGQPCSDLVLPAQGDGRSIDTQLRPRGLTTNDVSQLHCLSPSIHVWAQDSYTVGDRGDNQDVPDFSLAQDFDYLAIPGNSHHSRRTSAGHASAPRLWTPGSKSAASAVHVRPASEAGTASTGLYRCKHDDCQLVFDTLSKLRHHSRYHTPNGERKYACQFCDRRFVHRKDLIRHHLTHDPVYRPSFYCPFDTCGKSYRRKDHLSRHVKNKHFGASNSTSPLSVRSTDAVSSFESVCIVMSSKL